MTVRNQKLLKHLRITPTPTLPHEEGEEESILYRWRKVRIGVSPRGRLYILGFLVLLGAFVAAGCANGTYPLDLFYEMHYQQSYGPHEPPRLSPPAGAVPITGKDVPLESLTVDEIDELPNPFLRDDGVRERVDEGRVLYEVNCIMCHGVATRGDGEVLNIMREGYGYQVKLDPNLTGLEGLKEGRLFGIISDRKLVFPGIEGWVMPQFQSLLTAKERWMIVNYVRTLQGAPPPACSEELAGAELGRCQAVFQGCTACHSIDGSASTGPTWKGLYGKEETLEDGTRVEVDDVYLAESIGEPGAKVVKGFQNVMPTISLSQGEIEAITEYIKSLK